MYARKKLYFFGVNKKRESVANFMVRYIGARNFRHIQICFS